MSPRTKVHWDPVWIRVAKPPSSIFKQHTTIDLFNQLSLTMGTMQCKSWHVGFFVASSYGPWQSFNGLVYTKNKWVWVQDVSWKLRKTKMPPKVLILKSKMICICRIFSSSYHLEHFPEAFIWDKQREGNTSYRASYRGWVKIYHITSVSRKARNPTTLKRFFSFTLKGRSPEKKNAFFWILSKWGGGLAQFFGHLFTCGGQ